jgi:predicted permease
MASTPSAGRKGSPVPVSSWFTAAAHNLRFSLRQVARAPGFALFTVLTLALGIGAATAMFAIVDGVVLEPLPFARAHELYQPIATDEKGSEDSQLSIEDVRQWTAAMQGDAELAYSQGAVSILDAPTGAQLVSRISMSPNLLSMLGVHPAMGRGFLPEDRNAGNWHEALLSDSMWRREFFANRDVLGSTVRIAGIAYTIAGVMPPQFEYPLGDSRPQVWVPIEPSQLAPPAGPSFYSRSLRPILRIPDNADAGRLQARLTAVQQRIARSAKPEDEIPNRVRLIGLHESLVEGVRPALTALEIAVALVWLIACCNVAGLLLVRIAARRVEIAVRGALGAGRRRIAAQLLTESLALSAAGSLAGLGLAALILHLFRALLEKALPLAANIRLNFAVCAALVGATLFTGLAFGVIPAFAAARASIEENLRSGSRTASSSRAQARLRSLLLVSEVALSIVLMVGASLMMRTMVALRHVPLGFAADHVVMVDLTVPSDRYKDRNVTALAWNPLLARVRQIPGVDEAALSTVMPIGHPIDWLTVVYATPWTKGDVSAHVRAASPDLMTTLGIHMRSGRFFTDRDTASSAPVVVVNQAFVNRYLAGRNAVGTAIRYGRVPAAATIAGVLDDVRQLSVAEPSQPELYIPLAQIAPDSVLYGPLVSRYLQLAVRTQTAPAAMIPELRRAIRQENSNLALSEFTTLEQAVDDSMGSQRLAAGVIGVFGGLALLITMVGLYGMLSYSVAQRTQEIGIRMALGADRTRVMKMILRQAAMLLAFGVVAGLALALSSSRLLESFLYGVRRFDPLAFALAPTVLVLCGVAAALVPARRAASIDPMRALRME